MLRFPDSSSAPVGEASAHALRVAQVVHLGACALLVHRQLLGAAETLRTNAAGVRLDAGLAHARLQGFVEDGTRAVIREQTDRNVARVKLAHLASTNVLLGVSEQRAPVEKHLLAAAFGAVVHDFHGFSISVLN